MHAKNIPGHEFKLGLNHNINTKVKINVYVMIQIRVYSKILILYTLKINCFVILCHLLTVLVISCYAQLVT